MTGKRQGNKHGIGGDQKRQRVCRNPPGKDPMVKKTVLAQCYPQVFTLREYLLFKLPATSKVRRKKVLDLGRKQILEDGNDYGALCSFLDRTLVGVMKRNEGSFQERIQQWTAFSQKVDTSSSLFANLSGPGNFSQSEIVDFAIWTTFSNLSATSGRAQHLLCQGFRKDVSARSIHRGEQAISAIPGVISTYPNHYVAAMKASPWPEILTLMGKEGEKMMIDLILDCGVFVYIENSQGSYHQLSGEPLGDLSRFLKNDRNLSGRKIKTAVSLSATKLDAIHSPASITFVRNRMLYARPALNAQGKVRFGLRHIHVLNRFPYINLPNSDGENQSAQPNTIHVMMHMFPRLFGLHNVFTAEADSRQTVQIFKDYTMREDEIHAKFSSEASVKVPKRLRGKASNLVQKLQVRHSRCPYKILLEQYCPVASEDPRPRIAESDTSISTAFKTQKSVSLISQSFFTPVLTKALPRKPSMMDFATPISEVSAFCRAILLELIPHEFWGTGEVQGHNKAVFHRNVDRFIGLRRFETLSLHEVSQGIRIANIHWLGSPNPTQQKIPQSDLKKRTEIFHEFLYYVFDSILIPLLRANFHVTESNVHRYRLFFFRHDVWRSLAEPAIASLKLTMFEDVKRDKAQKILNSRTLGFSQIRLLPKQTGVRPIMNLRRRTLKKGSNDLGSSINSVLAPLYNILTFEKTSNPNRLGSTLFSVGDLYTRLKTFKSNIQGSQKPLYFAKVDVQAAFDTIPQTAVIKLMATVPSESEYRISKHVEVTPGGGGREGNVNIKPKQKWVVLAKSSEDFEHFDENLESELAVGRKNTVFIENVVAQFRDRDELLNLLTEHIEHNMVKIGKKFYRQKEGIPQGSVLSSLLCNYFYADLEAHHLQFLQSKDSLLLRLIDDFLLITTERAHAKKFLQVMHDGVPSYGVRVNPSKTLVNFEAVINGKKVERLVGSRSFPYCGSLIDTKALDITKDRERRRDMGQSSKPPIAHIFDAAREIQVDVVLYISKQYYVSHIRPQTEENWASRPLCHTQASDRQISSWVGDHQRIPAGLAIEDSLTVEFSRIPGKTFHRKILNAFKIQAHAMYLDTSHNSLHTVLSNIYSAFIETAMKLHTYNRCLPTGKQPGTKLLLKTISDVVELAFMLMKSKGRDKKNAGYKCAVKRVQVEWLAMNAFRNVMGKRQSKFRAVIQWLDEKIEGLQLKEAEMVERIKRIVTSSVT